MVQRRAGTAGYLMHFEGVLALTLDVDVEKAAYAFDGSGRVIETTRRLSSSCWTCLLLGTLISALWASSQAFPPAL